MLYKAVSIAVSVALSGNAIGGHAHDFAENCIHAIHTSHDISAIYATHAAHPIYANHIIYAIHAAHATHAIDATLRPLAVVSMPPLSTAICEFRHARTVAVTRPRVASLC